MWRAASVAARHRVGTRIGQIVSQQPSEILVRNQLFPAYIISRHYASAIKVILPALSPTMTEGVISKWVVKEGDEVSAGDVIFEMETDKATMEVESPDDGIIAKILVPAGTAKTAVNSLVAVMVEPGENPAEVEMPTDTAPAAPAPAAAPAAPAPAAAAPAAAPAASASSAGSGSGATTQDTLLPAVKNLVAMHSLDPAVIPATGPKGHLLKGDVLRFLETGEAVSAAATAGQAHAHGAGAGAGAAADAEYVDIELTNMRKIIAARLTESKQTIPHTYASVEVNLDKINAMRKALAEQGTKVSVNDFIVRAAGRALREVPQVNAQLAADGSIKQLDTVDISVAVATPTGLITPIVTNADARGVSSISQAIKDLAGRAREGKLKPHEYQGGSFSVSNLGMFGIAEFNAVINPPQAAIMAVGGGRTVPVPTGSSDSDPFAKDYSISTLMTAKVSFDERVVNSEDMAKWLTAFKTYMDDPAAMV